MQVSFLRETYVNASGDHGKEANDTKITINESGVFLDEQPVPNCTRVDIKNICPIDQMEVVLHVMANKADVQWEVTE